MAFQNWIQLFACFFLVFGIGAVNRVFRPGDWYASLAKPSWTPPNWAFPVVWPLLYLLMGFSLWLFWTSDAHPLKNTAIAFFFGQLLLNGMWSYLFFGIRKMGWAFWDIIGLFVCIGATILIGWSVSSLASLLLVPYLLWILFASALNHAVWKLNTP